MYAGLPPRRWCREVLALRSAAEDLLSRGIRLTDPRILSLSRRLDRLMLDACGTAGGQAPQEPRPGDAARPDA